MKRILLTAFLCLALLIAGCDKSTLPSSDEQTQGEVNTIKAENVYKVNEVEIPKDFTPASLAVTPDGQAYMFGRFDAEDYFERDAAFIPCSADGCQEAIMLPQLDIDKYVIERALMLGDGNYLVLVMDYADYTAHAAVVTPDGEYIGRVDGVYSLGDTLPSLFALSGNIVIVDGNRTAYLYDLALNVIGEYNIDYDVGHASEKDGVVYLHNAYGSAYCSLGKNGRTTDVVSDDEHGVEYRRDSEGNLYRLDNTGMYITTEDNMSVILADWNVSAIPFANVAPVGVIDGKTVFADMNSMLDSQFINPVFITESTDEFFEKREVKLGLVYLGRFGRELLNEIAALFNQSNDRYHVTFVDYMGTGMEVLQARDRFDNALVKGEYPDAVFINGDISKYTDKNMFADIAPYIDESGIKILANVRRAFTQNGKLHTLPINVGFTTYAAKTEALNGKPLTYDLLYKIDNGLGEGEYLATNGSYWTRTLPYVFTDKEAKTCSFDSEEFAQILKFTVNKQNELKNDIDAPKSIEIVNIDGYSQVRKLIENDALVLVNQYINSVDDYALLKSVFGGEDITLCGLPALNGGMSIVGSEFTYSIIENSAVKEGAAEFLKFMLSDSILTSNMVMRNGIPVTESAFEYIFEYDEIYFSVIKSMAQYSPYMQKEPLDEVNSLFRDLYVHLDESDMQKMYDFVTSLDCVYDCDDILRDIYIEESSMFISGAITAEEAAHRMQDRISVYVSE